MPLCPSWNCVSYPVLRLTQGCYMSLAGTLRYLVVCAHVQQYWQALLGRHSTTCRVQRQLAHRNAHPVAAQITQAQDTLTVRHHNGLQTSGGEQLNTIIRLKQNS